MEPKYYTSETASRWFYEYLSANKNEKTQLEGRLAIVNHYVWNNRMHNTNFTIEDDEDE